CRLAGPAHAAATAGFSIQEEEIPRETDCLLEETGFEPSVPLANQRPNCQVGLARYDARARGSSSGSSRNAPASRSTIRPSLMIAEISLGRCSTVMSLSGSLFQITMSASLPGAITPTSPSRPMSQALRLVLATIASIGGMPTSLANNSASLPC